jgi:hypothetical protein
LDGLGDSEGRVLGEHLLVLADHLVGDLESTLKKVNNVRHDGIICDTQHNSIECHYVECVIMAAFHSVGTKCRSLALPSENACPCKAASVIAPTCSGSRSSKLPFRKCCSFLCLLYHCYVLSLNLSKISSFKSS